VSHAFRLAEIIGDVQIVDWSDPDVRRRALEVDPTLGGFMLRYDEVYPSLHLQAVIVGEQAHFLYRLLQNSLNKDCYQAAREHIRTEAERILGEPWNLADEVA